MIVSDNVLLCPTVIVPKFNGELPAESDPAVAPVPVSGIASDGFDASLVTVSDELAAPLVVGANRTLNEVLAPAAKVIGKVAPVTLYAPVADSALMCTVVPPVLVSVSCIDLLVAV